MNQYLALSSRSRHSPLIGAPSANATEKCYPSAFLTRFSKDEPLMGRSENGWSRIHIFKVKRNRQKYLTFSSDLRKRREKKFPLKVDTELTNNLKLDTFMKK
jgi:hypothetical protein